MTIENPIGTVYIVDDDLAVRDALTILVKSVGYTAKAYATAHDFLDDCCDDQPGCLVTDVYLPGMDGIALQETLVESGNTLPVIVISGHGDIPMAVEMVRKGALDFLEKPFRNHVLLQSINRAIETDLERRLIARDRARLSEHFELLTPREKEVTDLLIEGAPNKSIALALDVSTRTIETHRANIFKKMRVRSVAALTQQVIRIRQISRSPY